MEQTITSQRFIKINNQYFYKDGIISNTFYLIGTFGFTLLCYILFKAKEDSYIETSLYFISKFFTYESEYIEDEKEKNKFIKRLKDSDLNVSLPTDVRTIKKYLTILEEQNYIVIENSIKQKVDLNKIKPKDLIRIKLNNDLLRPENNFNSISIQLFEENICKIGCNGWSILCLLSRLHNYNLGDQVGQSSITEVHIAEILALGTTAVKKYLNILCKNELLIISAQNIRFFNKKKEWKPFPNIYKVKHKLPKDKYYLDQYTKQIQAARSNSFVGNYKIEEELFC